jgi:hypothetical protein
MSMSPLPSLFPIALFLGLLFGTFPTLATAEGVEELLPGNSVLYLRFDGDLDHEKAFAETAAYRALYESGLMDALRGGAESLNTVPKGSQMNAVGEHLQNYGLSLSVAIDAPQPGPFAAWGTIVVPDAGEGVELLAELINAIPNLKYEVQEKYVEDRTVKYINLGNPLVDLGWWAEGDHLVIAFGMNSIASAMAVADGKRENITQHPLWGKYTDVDPEFDVAQFAWLDIESLRKAFGNMPLPPVPGAQGEPRTVQDLLEVLGLESLNHVAALSGYRGETMWSETMIDAPGDRHGLLALFDQHLLTLEELPAMPLNHLGIFVTSFDWGNAYESLLEVAVGLAEFGPPSLGEQIDHGLARVKQELGFELADLFDATGNINCLYSDASQGAFGLGTVAILSVEDASQLKACIAKLLTALVNAVEKDEPGAVRFSQQEKDGRQIFRIEIPKAPILVPTISVDDEWLIIGLIPQAVRAQELRLDGTMYSWSVADDISDALDQLPEEFTSLQIVDPTATYKALVSYAPLLLGVVEMAIQESGQMPPGWRMPIDASEIPPAELVVEPLFLNVAMSTVDQQGVQMYSRQSLPGLPLIGNSGGGASIGVLTALLIPAIQQAREAARRAQQHQN